MFPMMKILFLASEVAPFSKTGGLGDVAHALPAALARSGHDVKVVTPRYGSVAKSGLTPLGKRIRLRFPFGEQSAELFSSKVSEGHEVIFLDHPGYYDRAGPYGDSNGDYGDNARRFGFFSVGALAAAEALGFQPDVLHLNDWQCGPAAIAARRGFGQKAIGEASIVFTIHNLAYQGVFPKRVMDELGLPWDLFGAEVLEYFDAVNFLKGGLAFADVITTVSERYAQEIQTPAYGCDLDGFLRARRGRLFGIVNGIDTEEWNPATDTFIPERYSADDLSGKRICKRVLRRQLGLVDREDNPPLFGWVSRLTGQKGVELLLNALPIAMEHDLEVVLLGSGEPRYENALRALESRYEGRLVAWIGFEPKLSHWVEAGSDFFLMPSVYEPCGLNQMYSLRYGTVPIVRATGGLDDTVRHFTRPWGNGIKFEDHLPSALLWAMGQAMALYRSPEHLHVVRQVGMREDFSWERSARRYEALYRSLG